MEDKDFFTLSEAAIIFRVSSSTMYRLVKDGEIPVIRIGKRVLIPKSYFIHLENELLNREARHDT